MNKLSFRLILICLMISSAFLFQLPGRVSADDSIFLSPRDKKILLRAARKTIKDNIAGGKFISNLPENHHLYKIRAGIFVTIDRRGKIEGCRGTLEPSRVNILEEVSRLALAAAEEANLSPGPGQIKIESCRISITVVLKLIPANSIENIPKSDGIVIKQGEKTGVVLPYEGSDPFIRLQWAYKKAGLPAPELKGPGNLSDVFIMKAIRFAESDRELRESSRPFHLY